MNIEALVNLADESHVIDETTDEEICKSALDAWKAQEDGPINDGDNDVDDDAHMHLSYLILVYVLLTLVTFSYSVIRTNNYFLRGMWHEILWGDRPRMSLVLWMSYVDLVQVNSRNLKLLGTFDSSKLSVVRSSSHIAVLGPGVIPIEQTPSHEHQGGRGSML